MRIKYCFFQVSSVAASLFTLSPPPAEVFLRSNIVAIIPKASTNKFAYGMQQREACAARETLSCQLRSEPHQDDAYFWSAVRHGLREETGTQAHFSEDRPVVTAAVARLAPPRMP